MKGIYYICIKNVALQSVLNIFIKTRDLRVIIAHLSRS